MPITPAKNAEVRYSVPMSLWLVEYTHRTRKLGRGATLVDLDCAVRHVVLLDPFWIP